MNLGLKSGYNMLQQLKKKKCKTENVGAGLEKNSVTQETAPHYNFACFLLLPKETVSP